MKCYSHIVNRRFGKLVVTSILDKVNKYNRPICNCLCDCGNIVEIDVNSLLSGNSTSCSCSRRFNLHGMVFDRLTVINLTSTRSKSGDALWNCLCICGKYINVTANHLKTNHTKSCGCKKIESNKIHGLYNTKEYRVLAGIKQRCINKKNIAYYNYGGRGIKVCDRWLESFENFYTDMGPRPSDKHTIDRIDNNGNYEPGNCKWSTMEEQVNNRNITNTTIFNGNLVTVGNLAREIKFNYKLLSKRLIASWDIEKIIRTLPVKAKLLIIFSGKFSYYDYNKLTSADNPSLKIYIESQFNKHSIIFKRYMFFRFIDDNSVAIAYWV